MSAIFSFPILKNGKGRLFLLRVSNSKVLNAERIIEFHCEKSVAKIDILSFHQTGVSFHERVLYYRK